MVLLNNVQCCVPSAYEVCCAVLCCAVHPINVLYCAPKQCIVLCMLCV